MKRKKQAIKGRKTGMKAGGKRPKLSQLLPLRKKQVLALGALVVLAVALVLVISGVRYFNSFKALQNREPWAASLRQGPDEQGINYLLVGLTGEQDRYTVQDMLFLNYPDPGDAESHPNVLFIPGNLLMQQQEAAARPEAAEEQGENGSPAPADPSGPEGTGEVRPAGTRVQSYYTPTLLYEQGGAELLLSQLRLFLGTEIHHFVAVHYAGIAELVDDRGGIPYHGYTLQGSDFLQAFLHSEEAETPPQRALRRAGTLYNLVEFLGEKSGIFATPRMLRRAAPYVETDLAWREMPSFYQKFGRVFARENMVLSLPGDWMDYGGVQYFQPDLPLLATMMANLGSDFMIPREMITVEVLNGSGVSGIAGRTGAYLEEAGFQVVKVDNADHQDYPRSQVISRIDDIEAARAVALHIPGAEFFKEPVQDYPAMVTVIVGKNFDL